MTHTKPLMDTDTNTHTHNKTHTGTQQSDTHTNTDEQTNTPYIYFFENAKTFLHLSDKHFFLEKFMVFFNIRFYKKPRIGVSPPVS